MEEYPKMLYRDGSQIEHEGRKLDTLIVENEDEEIAADGWGPLVDEKAKPKK